MFFKKINIFSESISGIQALIYGIKVNKNLGYFVEGKYNKYWNREWYDFKFGINYVIF